MIVINRTAFFTFVVMGILIVISVFAIILPSIPLNNVNIAQTLINEYLDKFESVSIEENDRILEYSIDGITVTKESNSGFVFSVYFSVKPCSKDTSWYSANGYWDHGWVRGVYLTGIVGKAGGRYKIIELGTG